uniref:Uncharacterized protein n=1 Tax=Larimichthys crocea TaxID=215358 RepID=A0A0F8B658_LARCR
MGNKQEDYDRSASRYYQTASEHPSILPDVSIDESLLRYSGLGSNAVLEAYSNEMVSYVPQFIEKFGSMTPIPNAVGLGALVISMIIELCTNGAQTGSDSFSMIRRVFGEENASAVRDTMTDYLRRHQTFINNNQRLREEIQRLEQQLSKDLTVLRNSLLHDGQMSTRGFKIWVNGASFHLQMLIHEARLNRQADSVNRIRSTTDLYLQDLNPLLEKYRTHRDIFTVEIDSNTSSKLKWRGDSNATFVLSPWKVQVGRYLGKTFHWLLENDVGYSVNLVASHQKERERTGSQSPLMANKDAFTRYSSAYPDFAEAVRFHRAFEESRVRSLQPGQEGQALVGFGDFKFETLQSLYESEDSQKIRYVVLKYGV